MGRLTKEFTVAPDAQRLREAFPEMECISHAEFNQLLLRGMYKIIESHEIVLNDSGLRYFKVVAELNSEPAGN